MQFNPLFAEIRFGCGLSPTIPAPASVEAMISNLTGPDHAAASFPIPHTEELIGEIGNYRELKRDLRRADKDSDDAVKLQQALQNLRAKAARLREVSLRRTLMRGVWTQDGFRERLSQFWFDHFSAPGKNQFFESMTAPYIETAIRPFVSGHFGDMLNAVATHPQMIFFLDQTWSIGPSSSAADKMRKRGRSPGLNENLAREILELHTLGVDGPYTQKDVREFAELLTGMTSSEKTGFRYQADRAEPGEEIVLGKSYGGAKGRLEDIRAALNDLAIHPTTAEHLSRKLAIHFVSDTPTEALIQAMKTRYLDTGGHLAETYEAMLNHPDAWVREGANFKRPLAFLMSSLRALGVPEKDMMAWKPKHFQTHLTRPMTRMGQSWLAPMGPDGWAETDSHWMSPQGVAARLQWAMATPSFMMDTLPDPRTFLVDALGPEAPEDVVFAAQAAESRNVGVALVLMSPAFQRHGV